MYIRDLKYCLPFLQQGRLVQLSSHGVSWGWGWGVVVQARKTNVQIVGGIAGDKPGDGHKALGHDGTSAQPYILDVLVEVIGEEARQRLAAEAPGGPFAAIQSADYRAEAVIAAAVGDGSAGADPTAPPGMFPVPASAGDVAGAAMEIVPVSMQALMNISAIRIQLPKDLRKDTNRRQVQRAVREVLRRFPACRDGVPTLNPETDMNSKDPAFSDLLRREAELKTRISRSAFHTAADKEQQLGLLSKKYRLLEAAAALRTENRSSQAVAMRDELRRMKRVLRRLGYISADGVLELKGRFACELGLTRVVGNRFCRKCTATCQAHISKILRTD